MIPPKQPRISRKYPDLCRKKDVSALFYYCCCSVDKLLWHHELQHISLPVLHYLPELLKLTSIESMLPSNHLILCRTLLLLPSIFPNISVFSNESTLHIRWPELWSFSISTSNEYSGLISFRIDWVYLLDVQGTLKSFSPAPQLESISSFVLSLLYWMVAVLGPFAKIVWCAKALSLIWSVPLD